MRVFHLSKGRVSKKKPKTTISGGSVKANQLFQEEGKKALHNMLKPKTPQKYISFS